MNLAVIGLGFGDESKGATVDWLCSKHSYPVVRYSGGHQAGHNVIANGKQHICSNFGSGVLQGNPTYWEKQCPIDPIAIQNEYNKLQEIGITPTLYIDNKSPITTPIERVLNRKDDTILSHGSCGTGIRTTQIREEAYYSLVAMDIKYIDILKTKFDLIAKHFYNVTLQKDLYDEFIDACIWLNNCNDIHITQDEHHFNYIFESSQGLLLDKNIGFFPHVTPSNVGMTYFRNNNIVIDNCYYVTRAYQTRHGNGPMTNLDKDFEILDSKIDTNPTNDHQGEFKKSMLDLDLLKYGIERDGGLNISSIIVITCLEHLPKYAYSVKNNIYYEDNEESFCRSIANELGFNHIVMCKEHKFTWLKSV